MDSYEKIGRLIDAFNTVQNCCYNEEKYGRFPDPIKEDVNVLAIEGIPSHDDSGYAIMSVCDKNTYKTKYYVFMEQCDYTGHG